MEAHSYTAGLWMGVQPDKAGALLDGEDDGLRHRFVWTELVDPTKQGRSDNPPAAPHTVAVPGTITNGASMSFHEGIVEETRQMMAVTLKYGVQGHNAGHRHQTRLKLAAGLALLRSADTVALEDWRRAGVLMDYSDIVQGDCLAHLQGQRERDAAHRLEQRERAEEQATANRRERFRTKVLKELKDGNTLVRSQVLQSVRGDQRELMNAVLDTLELEGLITVTEGDRGRVFLQRNPHCPEGGK